MGIFGIILIIIALIGLYGILHITIYNHIQYLNVKINHVEGIIDEALRSKFDIIMRADDAIVEKLGKKKEYLKEYKELKDTKISNFDLTRKLEEAESIIENLANDYDELANNDNMLTIINDLKQIDEKISAGITYYNKHTTKLNSYISRFPNNFIAKIHRIKIKPYFDGKDMTDDDFEDFKL